MTADPAQPVGDAPALPADDEPASLTAARQLAAEPSTAQRLRRGRPRARRRLGRGVPTDAEASPPA